MKTQELRWRNWTHSVPYCLVALLLVGLLLFAFADMPAQAQSSSTYIFTTFGANGQTLSAYTSSDGLNFTLLSHTGYGGPTGIVLIQVSSSSMAHTISNNM
jgi:hypothetical protein